MYDRFGCYGRNTKTFCNSMHTNRDIIDEAQSERRVETLLRNHPLRVVFTAGQLLIDLPCEPRYSTAGGMLHVFALSLLAVCYGAAHQLYLALGIPRHYCSENIW